MSGTDSTPDAGNGRPADSGRRSDDGATRLAEALIAQLERIGTPTRVPVLTGAQARLETHYALLSNLLGNFGRHGTARDALLSPPPTLERLKTVTKLQLGPAIPGASTVTTYDSAGRRLEHLPYAASGINVQQPDAIVTVEVEDSHGVPFLVGFVTEPTDVGPY